MAPIEQQETGSNVCAFTATLFLSLAASKLVNIYKVEKPIASAGEGRQERDCVVERQKALAAYLDGLVVKKVKYEQRRRNALGDLAALCEKYAQHRAESVASKPVDSGASGSNAKGIDWAAALDEASEEGERSEEGEESEEGEGEEESEEGEGQEESEEGGEDLSPHSSPLELSSDDD